MNNSKIFIVLLFATVASISISNAQQWSPITSNNIWTLNAGNVGIGTTSPSAKLDVNGSLSACTTYKIKLMDFPGHAAWIDMPVVSGKACGIGSGGAGQNTWIAYAGATNQWFGGALIGDICYRNLNGRLLFGNTTIAPTMTIAGDKVGIGTDSPSAKLHLVESTLSEFAGTDLPYIKSNLVIQGTDNQRTIGKGSSITFSLPAFNNSSNCWEQARILATPDNTNTADARGRLYLQVRDLYQPIGLSGTWNWRTGLMIAANGNVGIGTTNPDQKLTVKGKIHAEEVIVDLNVPVADYVFKPTYKLMPLHEVEQFVRTNSHLPEIPSANEITKNGLSMGEMQNKLLQKVEELTLYAIEQDKNKKELERKYNVLLEKIEALTKQIEKKQIQ